MHIPQNEKKYKIGNVLVLASRDVIRVEFPVGRNGVRMRSVYRPVDIDMDKLTRIVFSENEDLFYMSELAIVGDGFWLGRDYYESPEDAPARTPLIVIAREGKVPYWRPYLPFVFWNVKAKAPISVRPRNCRIAKDYIYLAAQQRAKGIEQFNKEIEFTGWTLQEIVDRIGPWVEPEEPEPIELTK